MKRVRERFGSWGFEVENLMYMIVTLWPQVHAQVKVLIFDMASMKFDL